MSVRLFYIETNYQFLQSMAIIVDWVEHDGKNVVGNVCFIDATRDKFIFSNREVLKRSFGIEVVSIKVYSFYLSALISYFLILRFRKYKGCDFFMFNNRSPIVNRLCSIFCIDGDVIQIEEGLSLYRKPRRVKYPKTLALMFKRALISLLTASRFSDHIGDTVYSKVVYLRYSYMAVDNEFISSKKIIELPPLKKLTSILTILNEIYMVNKLSFDLDSDCIVFFGQPLSELGLLDLGKELQTLNTINNVVCSMGLKLIVKAHPAEDKNKYNRLGFMVIEGPVPAEVIFLNFFNVKAVISFYSTAALNISDILDVNAYFVYEICGLDVNFPKAEKIRILQSLDPDDLRFEFSRYGNPPTR